MTFSSLRGGSVALGLLPLFRRDTGLGVNLGISSHWMYYFTSLGLSGLCEKTKRHFVLSKEGSSEGVALFPYMEEVPAGP